MNDDLTEAQKRVRDSIDRVTYLRSRQARDFWKPKAVTNTVGLPKSKLDDKIK